jgi:predicted nucleic acid-binding Zn ribbon protein
MSLREPRCLVCSNPLDMGSPFKKTVRESEVCSDKCYRIYMTDDEGVFHPEEDYEGD